MKIVGRFGIEKDSEVKDVVVKVEMDDVANEGIKEVMFTSENDENLYLVVDLSQLKSAIEFLEK